MQDLSGNGRNDTEYNQTISIEDTILDWKNLWLLILIQLKYCKLLDTQFNQSFVTMCEVLWKREIDTGIKIWHALSSWNLHLEWKIWEKIKCRQREERKWKYAPVRKLIQLPLMRLVNLSWVCRQDGQFGVFHHPT